MMGGDNMDEIISAITNLGFPIVMCGAALWYVKYIEDKHREERDNMQQKHDEEMKSITAAINNNTIALTKLCEKIGGESEDE